MEKIKIVAFCGESASGKDTFQRIMCEDIENFNSIVSTTSRPIREGEKEGVNYYYRDKQYFIDNLNNFLEVSFFNDWVYGTEISSLSKDKINIGVFNPEGIRNLLEDNRIELLVFYISVEPKTRLLRSLNRETNPNVDEIVRRYMADRKDFALLDFDYITIDNNQENFETLNSSIRGLAKKIARTKQDNSFSTVFK